MASSTSSETSPKRRRVSQELLHDEDLWLEDGNIVIAATDETQEEKAVYAFKCHRSVLTKHSSVFEGLLSIPPSTDTQDLYEGLPLITLPDQYADVKGLLRFLYDSSEMPWDEKRPWDVALANKTLKTIAGPLRLTMKYEFTKLHARLVHAVESIWPSTLPDIDARRSWLAAHPGCGKSPSCAASVIALGYELQLLDIVTSAFYILNGEFYGVLSFSTRAWLGYDMAPPERIVQNTESLMSPLPPCRVAQFLAGRETLHCVMEALLRRALPTSTCYISSCNKLKADDGSVEGSEEDTQEENNAPMDRLEQTPCASAVKDWWRHALPSTRSMASIYADPLHTLARLADNCRKYEGTNEMCGQCTFTIASTLDAARQFMWSELPYIFSVKHRDENVQNGFIFGLQFHKHFYNGF